MPTPAERWSLGRSLVGDAFTKIAHLRRLVRRLVTQNWQLLTCGFALELALLTFFLVTQFGNWGILPILFFLPFAIYCVSLWARKRFAITRSGLVLILLFAIAFRLTLLFSGPVFSFDMYRYVWDGKVTANGINPYLYPPDAPELSFLRDSNWNLVNHKDLRTGYPPLMEMLFTFLYVSTQNAFSYKLTYSLLDIATIFVLYRILTTLKIDSRNLIVYGWAPLPIVEISQTGHNDALAVFLVLLSILLLLRGRKYSSAAAMSLAVLAKIYPIFSAPIFFKQWGKRGTLLFFASLLVFHLPFAGNGLLNIYSGGISYAINESYFNGSIFPLVANIVELGRLTSDPKFVAQIATYTAYGLLLVWALFRTWRGKDPSQVMKISFILTGAVLLLNRSLFPWYLTWILPFLTFYGSLAWIFLSGSIFLSYLKYNALPPPPFEGVTPQVALAIDIAEYVPFFALLAYEIAKDRIIFRRSARGQSEQRHC